MKSSKPAILKALRHGVEKSSLVGWNSPTFLKTNNMIKTILNIIHGFLNEYIQYIYTTIFLFLSNWIYSLIYTISTNGKYHRSTALFSVSGVDNVLAVTGSTIDTAMKSYVPWHQLESWTPFLVPGWFKGVTLSIFLPRKNYIHPRKLTWQWNIHHEWRCISYWKWGFSNVMLVFKGVTKR